MIHIPVDLPLDIFLEEFPVAVIIVQTFSYKFGPAIRIL